MTIRKSSRPASKSSRPAPRKARASSSRPRRKGRSRRTGSGGRWWALSVGALLSLALLVGLLWLFVRPLFWTGGDRSAADLADYNVRGIDISHWQPHVDWQRLQEARLNGFPIRFVIVKSTEGTDRRDRRFREYITAARRANFIAGAYHFFRPEQDAEAQARFYLKNTALESGDLPAILDVEVRGDKPLQQFHSDVLTWLRTVEAATGRPPILYTGVSFRQQYLRDEHFDTYPFWAAHYNGKRAPRYRGRWALWQYTDQGRVSGVEGPVDLNVFNGKIQDLQALCLP